MSSFRLLRRASAALILLLLVAACDSNTEPRLAPYDLKIISGDGQQVKVGTVAAPLVLEVVDIEGNPVPGSTVNWEVATGDVQIAGTTTVADRSGRTQMVAMLGLTPGLSVVSAKLPLENFSVTFNLFGTP